MANRARTGRLFYARKIWPRAALQTTGMGEVISLTERRRAIEAARVAGPVARPQRATFFFDLALPETYLAAERVERNFPGLRWQPASLESLAAGQPLSEPSELARVIAEAETRA